MLEKNVISWKCRYCPRATLEPTSKIYNLGLHYNQKRIIHVAHEKKCGHGIFTKKIKCFIVTTQHTSHCTIFITRYNKDNFSFYTIRHLNFFV